MLLQTQPHANVPGKLASLALHILFVLALILLANRTPLPILQAPPHPTLIFRKLPPPLNLPPSPSTAGGSSGSHAITPASHGTPPPPAPIPILMQVERPKVMPALPVEPAMELSTPVRVQDLGDPFSNVLLPSSGHGRNGIGDGEESGLGTGHGKHVGPGTDLGSGVFQPGNGVTAPKLIYRVDPEYSEEARKVKVQGSLTLSVVIDPAGHIREIHVTKGLGLGLDEKAMEAVRKWRFEPGRKAGVAVPISAVIEVNFRLL